MGAVLIGDRYGEGLKNVEYEVGTMVDAAIRYDELRRGSGEKLSRNVFLEAALLHARNLIEFLAVKNARDDYLTPEHFAKGWDYESQRELLHELGPLNVHLSHLSEDRLDPHTTQIATDIFRRILYGCRCFQTHISKADESRGNGIGMILDRVEKVGMSIVNFEVEVEIVPFSTSDTRTTADGFYDPLQLGLN